MICKVDFVPTVKERNYAAAIIGTYDIACDWGEFSVPGPWNWHRSPDASHIQLRSGQFPPFTRT